MSPFVFIVFVLMPALGLLFSIRIWLFLRNGVRVTARIVGHKEKRWDGGIGSIDSDNVQFLPIVSFRDERGREHRVTLKHERPEKWRGVRANEIKLIYRRGDPQHPKMAHAGFLWLVPAFLLGPSIVLLIALGGSILAAKLFP